jgi:hypothetical protein
MCVPQPAYFHITIAEGEIKYVKGGYHAVKITSKLSAGKHTDLRPQVAEMGALFSSLACEG